MNPIPTHNDGHVDWKSVFQPINIGVRFRATHKQIVSGYSKASDYGFSISGRKTPDGHVLTVLSHGNGTSDIAISPNDYNAALRRDGDLVKRLTEAQENLAYWRRQKSLRTEPSSRADAGARVLAWEMQVKSLSEKLTPAIA